MTDKSCEVTIGPCPVCGGEMEKNPHADLHFCKNYETGCPLMYRVQDRPKSIAAHNKLSAMAEELAALRDKYEDATNISTMLHPDDLKLFHNQRGLHLRVVPDSYVTENATLKKFAELAKPIVEKSKKEYGIAIGCTIQDGFRPKESDNGGYNDCTTCLAAYLKGESDE